MEMTHRTFTIRDLFSKKYRYSLLGALAMLGFAYGCEYLAILYEHVYSLRPTSVYVGDLLLDNLPIANLNFLIIEVALIATLIATIFVFLHPRYVLFTLKSVALLVAVRAFFISLTHVGIYPGVIYPSVGVFDGLYTYLNLQTGFFFSGHTSLPFLMALIFWRNKPARIVFLSVSIVFAVAVLLGHTHYSIDVFAAPFMAYGVFAITKSLFPRDYQLTVHSELA